MRDADAVIILCNKNCRDPTVEDTTNILRFACYLKLFYSNLIFKAVGQFTVY